MTRAVLDSMFFLLKTLDKPWDLLEQLGWDNYEREKVKKNLGWPANDPPVFRANSYSYDQCRDLYAQQYHSIPCYVST